MIASLSARLVLVPEHLAMLGPGQHLALFADDESSAPLLSSVQMPLNAALAV